MTRISICLETNLCVLPKLELDTLRYRQKKSMNGVYNTTIDQTFIQGMVENYCTFCKIQP